MKLYLNGKASQMSSWVTTVDADLPNNFRSKFRIEKQSCTLNDVWKHRCGWHEEDAMLCSPATSLTPSKPAVAVSLLCAVVYTLASWISGIVWYNFKSEHREGTADWGTKDESGRVVFLVQWHRLRHECDYFPLCEAWRSLRTDVQLCFRHECK